MLFDDAVVDTLVGMTPEWLALVLLFVGFLGSVYVIFPGVVLGAVTGGQRRLSWPAIICLPYSVFVFVKPTVDLSRPDVGSPIVADELPAVIVPVYELGTSFETGAFPSGHVLAATVFWGLVVVDTSAFSLWVRASVAGTIVSLIGVSRVVLGVHYPGDVLGSMVIGLAVLALVFVSRRRLSAPSRPLLVLSALFTTGGVLAGRLIDGGLFLALIFVLFVAYTWLERHDTGVVRAVKSRTIR